MPLFFVLLGKFVSHFKKLLAQMIRVSYLFTPDFVKKMSAFGIFIRKLVILTSILDLFLKSLDQLFHLLMMALTVLVVFVVIIMFHSLPPMHC